MESPVDRVENASRAYAAPGRVRHMTEAAPEKDEKFVKVLREKMDKEQHHKEQKREKPKDAVELLLSDGKLENDDTEVASQDDDSDDADSTKKSQEGPADHLDLTA